MPEQPWSDSDRDLVAQALAIHKESEVTWEEFATANPLAAGFMRAGAEAVLDALTAAGWEARCECDGVVHDLPILRAHLRGEPGCEAAIDTGSSWAPSGTEASQ